MEKRQCDIGALVEHIQASGISQVQLSKARHLGMRVCCAGPDYRPLAYRLQEHILNVIDVLVLDGRVERISGVSVQYRIDRLNTVDLAMRSEWLQQCLILAETAACSHLPLPPKQFVELPEPEA